MKPFRRGMTVLERQKLREQVLAQHLRVAQQRAAEYGLTVRCREAMKAAADRDSARAKALHSSCHGEDTGTGCLCHCHDRARPAQVVSGNAG